MDIHQKTGMAIVQLRKEQGISQYNLAQKANITFRYLSDIRMVIFWATPFFCLQKIGGLFLY